MNENRQSFETELAVKQAVEAARLANEQVNLKNQIDKLDSQLSNHIKEFHVLEKQFSEWKGSAKIFGWLLGLGVPILSLILSKIIH